MAAQDQLHNIKMECWITRRNKRSHIGVTEDKKLELRLGLPGDIHDLHEDKKALLSQLEENNNWQPNRSDLAFYKNNPSSHQNNKACDSTNCNTTGDDHDSKFAHSSSPPNCCNKRTARAPVVGWPPVRSSRKNLASIKDSSKTPVSNSVYDQKVALKDQGKIDHDSGIKSDKITKDHLFVKINMEGVPIGRKVDLKAYDSYEKLSYAIDELFRGLLAAQRDYNGSESGEESVDAKTVSNGEYTLVYEDNEGDRMLVGDVPWMMFVSTAKRLRVLRTAELSTLKLTSTQAEKTPVNSMMIVGN